MSRFDEKHFFELAPLLEANFCTGFKAPTGVGKSSYFPQYLAQHNATVFITQPTVPATIGLEQRLSELIGKNKVGWAAEGDVNYDNNLISQVRGNFTDRKDTQIVYCTQGHMRRVIIAFIKSYLQKNNNNFAFATFLMLDEAHIGSLDYEIIMALLNWSKLRGIKIPRLILSSATLNIKNTPFPSSPVYEMEIKSLPVTIYYHTRDYKVENIKALYTDLAAVVREKHRNIGITDKGDSWMVFCAGVAEIELVKNLLINESNMDILTAYSNMNSQDIKLIFNPPVSKKRKVILATNIAEASITVEGLSGIFDCMTEKVAETSSSGGARLVVKNISKSSATQRKGRTGRTVAGFCYRMCTENLYNSLPTSQAKEIERIPLHNVFIELFDAGITPETLFDTKTLNPEKVSETIKVLKYLNAITPEGSITELGRFLPTIPLSVQNGTVLYKWIHNEKNGGKKLPIFPAIVCISMIECYSPSYFFYPSKKNTDENYDDIKNIHYDKYFSQYNASSPIEVFLNLWMDIYNTFESIWKEAGVYYVPKGSLVKFCNDRSLNHVKVREFMKIMEQIINELYRQRYDVLIGKFNINNFLDTFEPILFNVYKNSIAQQNSADIQKYKLNKSMYSIDQRNLLNDFPTNYETIYSLMTFESVNQNKVNKFITLYHPMNRDKTPIAKPVIQPVQVVENVTINEIIDEDIIPNEENYKGPSPSYSVFSKDEMMSPPYNTQMSPPYNTTEPVPDITIPPPVIEIASNPTILNTPSNISKVTPIPKPTVLPLNIPKVTPIPLNIPKPTVLPLNIPKITPIPLITPSDIPKPTVLPLNISKPTVLPLNIPKPTVLPLNKITTEQ